MKPHFKPGDQVITIYDRTGTITHGARSPITGKWLYWVSMDGSAVENRYYERDLWHLDGDVARERAYARKGFNPDGSRAGLGPHDPAEHDELDGPQDRGKG